MKSTFFITQSRNHANMLSYMHSDLIQQSHSHEAYYRREYRPQPPNEQYILDFVSFLCISIDTFVISTIVSVFYFPEHVSAFQTIVLLILCTLFISQQIGQFLWQLQQHRAFVNSRKQFIVRAWEDPNIEYICELVWKNPESILDFRTHPVRVGQRFIRSPRMSSHATETPVSPVLEPPRGS